MNAEEWETIISALTVGVQVNEEGKPEVTLTIPGEAVIVLPAYLARAVGSELVEAGIRSAVAASVTDMYHRAGVGEEHVTRYLDRLFDLADGYLKVTKEGGPK